MTNKLPTLFVLLTFSGYFNVTTNFPIILEPQDVGGGDVLGFGESVEMEQSQDNIARNITATNSSTSTKYFLIAKVGLWLMKREKK